MLLVLPYFISDLKAPPCGIKTAVLLYLHNTSSENGWRHPHKDRSMMDTLWKLSLGLFLLLLNLYWASNISLRANSSFTRNTGL